MSVLGMDAGQRHLTEVVLTLLTRVKSRHISRYARGLDNIAGPHGTQQLAAKMLCDFDVNS